jgi:hypothetical protein
MACPEPAHPDAALKHLHANGVCGARVNFVRHLSPNGFDKATCWQVVRRIEPLGWHLELHVDAADLARLRGFEGFASRKSLKIRTGVQKVFTTKRWMTSPEKLRRQVSGSSDSWRWLIR